MQGIKKRFAAILAAALVVLTGCSSRKAASSSRTEDLPDTLSAEEVELPDNKAAYRCTSYQYEDDELVCKYFQDFDDHDNIIRSETAGDPENMELTKLYSYTYDKNGNVTAKTQSYADPPSTDRDIYFHDRFCYYDDGTLKYHVNYTKDSDSGLWKKNYRKEYDSHGSEVLYISYNSDGSTGYRSETQCEYDSSGNLAKETWHSDGSSMVSEYTYDEAGNILTAVRTESSEDSDESFVYKTEYAYDSRGNLIKETKTDPYDVTVSTEYEYDETNRLIYKDIIGTGSDVHTTYRYEYEKISG